MAITIIGAEVRKLEEGYIVVLSRENDDPEDTEWIRNLEFAKESSEDAFAFAQQQLGKVSK